METLAGFPFQAVETDRKGNVTDGLTQLGQHLNQTSVTDLILLCHGFRNDENDARALYSEFLTNLKPQLSHPSLSAKLAGRTYVAAGHFWPSMVFREPNDSGGAMSVGAPNDDELRLRGLMAGALASDEIEELVRLLPSAKAGDERAQLKMASRMLKVAAAAKDVTGEFPAVGRANPSVLRQAFGHGDAITASVPGTGGGGAAGIPTLNLGPNAGGAQSFFGNVVGFIPKFLNLTTFLVMFERSGRVGEVGMARIVREAKAAKRSLRVHLVGHSLGGRAVTACANELVQNPVVQIDSMMLLQAAYSHFGLGPGMDGAPKGHFRDVIDKKAVRLPILATHSRHDAVVGFAYTSMAAISLNNSKAIGDENSQFGGVGRNGVLKTPESVKRDLLIEGNAYSFPPDHLYNLDGSRIVDGVKLIKSHGDVRNKNVTWAFASLLALT
jgi:hypothetical protein